MAFITSTPIVTRTNNNNRSICQSSSIRMNSEASTTAAIPINGDKKHEMKEMYSLQPGKKVPICRCWQSKKFPLCDGSHNKLNKETGSYVGPLVVSAAKEE